MSYEKDKIDSFVTSVSLSTALAPYVTSNSLSSAIAGLDLAPYMTSNSISSGVATDVLTVRGAASVSATLSAGAVTVAGSPVGYVLIGHSAGTNISSFAFSGSWSDFGVLELHMMVLAGGGQMPISIFTDGGGTPILAQPFTASYAAATKCHINDTIYGVNGVAAKGIGRVFANAAGAPTLVFTATANTGFINCVRVAISVTASVAMATLYGLRSI